VPIPPVLSVVVALLPASLQRGYRRVMADPNGLATFLRARRDLVKPADAGLPDGERRRVAGLRREEVAMLAGISTEYYLRLEQGRERQPSDHVLNALAQALQLSDDATEYMRNLARPEPRQRRRASIQRVDPDASALIETWHFTPAYVQDYRMTVLAANPMAQALLPYFTPQTNLLRALLLEPETRTWVRNWSAISVVLVSWLRFTLAEDSSSDPELQSLIGELSIVSERFRTLWARHEVKRKTRGPTLIDHPQVGPLDLRYQVFPIPETRQHLVAYHAERGSPSEERLHLLSSLVVAAQL
jgi:transcriptional regulator with XRE-family HTH domain